MLAIAAGSLMLLDSPEAAAHKEVRNVHLPSAYYHVEHRRAKHMPYWLKRNKPFVRWYRHSGLKKNRFVSWHQLFRIYRWERSFSKRYMRDSRAYRDHRHPRLYADLRPPRRAGKHKHGH
ncbi:MAG: hypothetical protein KJO46_07980 [Gammaproteobacteria bacterium]|nr:hypothetical protein [Gammaproteobacteria bacterium]